MNKLAVLATVASVAATQSVIVNKSATIEVDSNCTVTFTKMENFTGNATVNSTVHTLNTRFNCTGINTSKLANNELPYVAVTFLPGTNSAPAANNDVSYCYLKGYTPTPDIFPTRHIPKLRAAAQARYADVLANAGRR